MVEVYVSAAFCKGNNGGNKAGVVLNREDLSVNQKKNIAKLLGFSETVFVQYSDAADYNLQFYTPEEEVELCGHATIATFFTLKALGLTNKQAYTIETKAGVLNIRISENAMVFMEQNIPQYYELLNPNIFEPVFQTEYISRVHPIQIVSTGLKDIMLPIKSKEALDTLAPNFKYMSDLSEKLNVVGVHAFALSDSFESTAFCRNFAPLYGIDEESATGTSNCALACYLFKHHAKQTNYIFEQGYNMGEPSQIIVKLEYKDDEIESVYVGGRGVLLEKRVLDI